MTHLHEPLMDPQRRDLLTLTVTAPMAWVGSLFVAVPGVETAQIAPTPAPPAGPGGYHVSQHIETYYTTLRY